MWFLALINRASVPWKPSSTTTFVVKFHLLWSSFTAQMLLQNSEKEHGLVEVYFLVCLNEILWLFFSSHKEMILLSPPCHWILYYFKQMTRKWFYFLHLVIGSCIISSKWQLGQIQPFEKGLHKKNFRSILRQNLIKF